MKKNGKDLLKRCDTWEETCIRRCMRRYIWEETLEDTWVLEDLKYKLVNEEEKVEKYTGTGGMYTKGRKDRIKAK